MFWYRVEWGLERQSVVGITVCQTGRPEHLLANECYQPRDGENVS
jgi:hypothetical protein